MEATLNCLICSNQNQPINNSNPFLVKSALQKIFEYFQIPKEEAETLKKSFSRPVPFCPSCIPFVEEIGQLQHKLICLDLQMQSKVETLGNNLVDSPHSISVGNQITNNRKRKRKEDIVWEKFQNPVIQNYAKGSLPNPSVRLNSSGIEIQRRQERSVPEPPPPQRQPQLSLNFKTKSQDELYNICPYPNCPYKIKVAYHLLNANKSGAAYQIELHFLQAHCPVQQKDFSVLKDSGQFYYSCPVPKCPFKSLVKEDDKILITPLWVQKKEEKKQKKEAILLIGQHMMNEHPASNSASYSASNSACPATKSKQKKTPAPAFSSSSSNLSSSSNSASALNSLSTSNSASGSNGKKVFEFKCPKPFCGYLHTTGQSQAYRKSGLKSLIHHYSTHHISLPPPDSISESITIKTAVYNCHLCPFNSQVTYKESKSLSPESEEESLNDLLDHYFFEHDKFQEIKTNCEQEEEEEDFDHNPPNQQLHDQSLKVSETCQNIQNIDFDVDLKVEHFFKNENEDFEQEEICAMDI